MLLSDCSYTPTVYRPIALTGICRRTYILVSIAILFHFTFVDSRVLALALANKAHKTTWHKNKNNNGAGITLFIRLGATLPTALIAELSGFADAFFLDECIVYNYLSSTYF